MADIYVATTGNDTTGDGSSGNPYATPGKAMGVASAGDRIGVKTGTYALTTSTANVAGGRINFVAGVRMEGYASAIGDMGSAPTITAGAQTSVVLVTLNGTFNTGSSVCINVIVDGLGNSTITGFKDLSGYISTLTRCTAQNCTTGFYSDRAFSATGLVGCKAVACGIGFDSNSAGNTSYTNCWAHGCTSFGFKLYLANSTSVITRCIASGTTGGPGFGNGSGWGVTFIDCVAANNNSDGFLLGPYDIFHFVNCVATGNGGYGFNAGTGAGASAQYNTCAGYNNTSGDIHVAGVVVGALTLTADPWTSSTDFTPNTTAGGGAVLRAAGFGVFGQTGYNDAGAVQHQDSGGGGGGLFVPGGFDGGFERR